MIGIAASLLLLLGFLFRNSSGLLFSPEKPKKEIQPALTQDHHSQPKSDLLKEKLNVPVKGPAEQSKDMVASQQLSLRVNEIASKNSPVISMMIPQAPSWKKPVLKIRKVGQYSNQKPQRLAVRIEYRKGAPQVKPSDKWQKLLAKASFTNLREAKNSLVNLDFMKDKKSKKNLKK